MDPDGMLNGWNSKVRITSAMIKAWNTTRPPSASPPSLRFPSVDTLIGLSSFELSTDFSIGFSTACSTAFLAISFTRVGPCTPLDDRPQKGKRRRRLEEPQKLRIQWLTCVGAAHPRPRKMPGIPRCFSRLHANTQSTPGVQLCVFGPARMQRRYDHGYRGGGEFVCNDKAEMGLDPAATVARRRQRAAPGASLRSQDVARM